MEKKNENKVQVVTLDAQSRELLVRATIQDSYLKERIDRHSLQYEKHQEKVLEAIKDFSVELKDIRKESNDKYDKLSKEIANTKLEGLKNDVKFTLKTIGFIGTVATIFGAAGAGIKDLITR